MMHNHNFEPLSPGRKMHAKKKRVDMDGRVFFVGINEDGTPRNICERKRRSDGLVRSETYWHHSQPTGKFGRGKRTKTGRTIIMDILAAAGVDARHFTGH